MEEEEDENHNPIIREQSQIPTLRSQTLFTSFLPHPTLSSSKDFPLHMSYLPFPSSSAHLSLFTLVLLHSCSTFSLHSASCFHSTRQPNTSTFFFQPSCVVPSFLSRVIPFHTSWSPFVPSSSLHITPPLCKSSASCYGLLRKSSAIARTGKHQRHISTLKL